MAEPVLDQRGSDPFSLALRTNRHRAKGEPFTFRAVDPHAREGYVADDPIAIGGDERRFEMAIAPQPLDDRSLVSTRVEGIGKGAGDQRAYRLFLARALGPDYHRSKCPARSRLVAR